MSQENIICRGIRCLVNAKAAFMDECVEIPEFWRWAESERPLCVAESGDGYMAGHLSRCLDSRKQMFEQLFGERLEQVRESFKDESGQLRATVAPLLDLDGQEIRIDGLGFLACALLQNERCLMMLDELFLEDGSACYEAYLGSEYRDSPLLGWLWQDESGMAKKVIGLLLLVRADGKACRYYREVMEIFYFGYRGVYHAIRKMESFCGQDFQQVVRGGEDEISSTARMFVQLVMAQDLGIPVCEDYKFYQALYLFQNLERNMMRPPELPPITPEGKQRYRKWKKLYFMPGSLYHVYWEERDGAPAQAPWEKLLLCGGLNFRALGGLSLGREELQRLLSVVPDDREQTYQMALLIAELCKYIKILQTQCDTLQGGAHLTT